jgi:O-antigen/teichoic acid export membrane protein
MLEKKTDSIAKNTTYYTLALIFQKILAFVYFSLIARFLGTEDTGKYVFALSFTTLFAILIDLGLASVLTREVAKDKEKAQRYLSNILALKIPLAIVVYLLVAGMVNIFSYSEETRSLVYISGIIMFLDSFSLTFWAVLRGRQKLRYESLGIMGLQLITVILGGAVLYYHLGLRLLMVALLMGSLANLIFAIIVTVKKMKLLIIPHYEPAVLKMLFKIGVPFALSGIFNRIFTTLDTVLLASLAGASAVGWYSIPNKITGALQFLPMAFIAALFPAMSEYFVTDREKLARSFERAMRYLMIISLPIIAGVIVLAEPVIINVYTEEFARSISPLKILIVGLFFAFLNFPVGYLLNAANKQTTNTVNMGVTVVISVVLNIILIPRYSYMGAAVSSLVSTFILFVLGMYWVPKIIKYDVKRVVINFFKILMASLVMGIIIHYIGNNNQYITWYFLVPIGAAAYFGALWGLKGITAPEIKETWRSVFKS